ncbi:hypothetical protein O0L34_g19355 [Tuta absoluta]|nr:hypothetical protein O0L34_g19355 [Tuta absoluta]
MSNQLAKTPQADIIPPEETRECVDCVTLERDLITETSKTDTSHETGINNIKTIDEGFVNKRRRRALSLTFGSNGTNKLSVGDITFYSVPDLSIRAIDLKNAELSHENLKLRSQLESADREVENLMQENFDLKAKVNELEKNVTLYKTLYVEAFNSAKKKLQQSMLENSKMDEKQQLKEIENDISEDERVF